MNILKHFLKIIVELGKVRIALPVALSALAGFVLYKGEINSQALLMALGVFLMACASGTLNHWQERKTDAKMPRTQLRPLPSGRITSLQGFMVALGYAAAGSFILLFSNPLTALVLSWATLASYNLIYTPLKKVTAFAVIPGSLVGALPPLIGWTAAGGQIFSETILIVATFFFIGQIPHFWLLLMLFGDQYKLAGLPSLTDIFSEVQLKRVTYAWVLTTIASAFLVLFFVFTSRILLFILLAYVLFLMISLSRSVIFRENFKVLQAFYQLNFLYLFMMLFLIAEGLLR
ncbi:protoheme IX farnesyltransferase [Tangfeifania diversioriginum]|uniref:Protoheme IX farnesyltransferase n=1 Tax=Tangfeifania diversioriginum TaxID=1168035 RepID=A0A1M6DGK1_9BACT|nr:protoheme IX farnesyltransferase [Tangfeifania diversioriginum]SHI72243.1 protoheme IX farnesyltransferase [Tangfeifania diversioriginum]